MKIKFFKYLNIKKPDYNFENREKCIKALQQRVCVDIPDEYSFVYNAIHGGGFENSPYCLKRYYTDISKLTFHVEELN